MMKFAPAAVLSVGLATPALADTITLGSSIWDNVWHGSYWIDNLGTTLSVTAHGALSGYAFLNAGVGDPHIGQGYVLGAFPPTLAGPVDAQGNYPADIQQPLDIKLPGGELAGTFNIQNIEDPPTVSAPVGVLNVSTASGEFANLVGGSLPMDGTLNGPVPDPGWDTDLSASAFQIVLPSPVQEPGALPLLSAALLCFAGWVLGNVRRA